MNLGDARCPACGTKLALGLDGLLLCTDCGHTYLLIGERLLRRPWPGAFDTPFGVFRFLGSECTDVENCGNTTYDSMTCDSCDSVAHTVPIYVADETVVPPPAPRPRPRQYRPLEVHAVPSGDVSLAVSLINEYYDHHVPDALVCNSSADVLRNAVKILMAERAGEEPPWVEPA